MRQREAFDLRVKAHAAERDQAVLQLEQASKSREAVEKSNKALQQRLQDTERYVKEMTTQNDTLHAELQQSSKHIYTLQRTEHDLRAQVEATRTMSVKDQEQHRDIIEQMRDMEKIVEDCQRREQQSEADFNARHRDMVATCELACRSEEKMQKKLALCEKNLLETERQLFDSKFDLRAMDARHQEELEQLRHDFEARLGKGGKTQELAKEVTLQKQHVSAAIKYANDLEAQLKDALKQNAELTKESRQKIHDMKIEHNNRGTKQQPQGEIESLKLQIALLAREKSSLLRKVKRQERQVSENQNVERNTPVAPLDPFKRPRSALSVATSADVTSDSIRRMIDEASYTEHSSIASDFGGSNKNVGNEVEREPASGQQNNGPENDQTLDTIRSSPASPAKSILKNTTGRAESRMSQRERALENTSYASIRQGRPRAASDVDTKEQSRHEHSRTSTRRRTVSEDFTSAFIIPDIHEQLGAHAPARSTHCQHARTNCTICTRIEFAGQKPTTKRKVQIQRPVPVSDDVHDDADYEEEHTMRPSVDPGVALATVIKSIRDEIAHLKANYETKLRQYHDLDARAARAVRKSLKDEIDHIGFSIDVKNDQIYALFDVVEGQKTAGQLMSQDEIDVTVLSITERTFEGFV